MICPYSNQTASPLSDQYVVSTQETNASMDYQAKAVTLHTLNGARNTLRMAQIMVDAKKVVNVIFSTLDYVMTQLNISYVQIQTVLTHISKELNDQIQTHKKMKLIHMYRSMKTQIQSEEMNMTTQVSIF